MHDSIAKAAGEINKALDAGLGWARWSRFVHIDYKFDTERVGDQYVIRCTATPRLKTDEELAWDEHFRNGCC